MRPLSVVPRLLTRVVRSRALTSSLLLSSVLLGLLAAGCSPTLPPRYVLERDVDELSYRRYQHVLDIEFAIEGNAAEGHTATYLERDGDALLTSTAFVSVYAHGAALASEVREQIEELNSYDVGVIKREGEWMWELRTGGDSVWLVWVSGRHVVKLGGPEGRDVADALVDAYASLYPSDLDDHGNAREGTESAGAAAADSDGDGDPELEVPSSLREGAPR